MNYKKVLNKLKDELLIDERNLFCYSNANVTRSKANILYTSFTTETQKNLPSFMLLSIKDDKLHISKTTLTGGFKNYYATLDIFKLTFIKSYKLDFIHTYEFNYDLGENKSMSFKIHSVNKLKLTFDVVDAIKKFNKEN